MTEAERLRSQAERCTQIPPRDQDRGVADTLLSLATKSLEQASDLERRVADQRQRRNTSYLLGHLSWRLRPFLLSKIFGLLFHFV